MTTLTDALGLVEAARREELRKFIDVYCIKRVPAGSKELPSLEGGFYRWQFYLRAAVLEPVFLTYITSVFWKLFLPRYRERPFQIAGIEQASIPILTAILLSSGSLGLHAFTIRKERKTYGRRNLIEGVPSNLPVVIIDDLTSPQHNAFWHAVHAVTLAELKLYSHSFVLVRKQKKEDSPLIDTSCGKVAIESIFTLDDFNLFSLEGK